MIHGGLLPDATRSWLPRAPYVAFTLRLDFLDALDVADALDAAHLVYQAVEVANVDGLDDEVDYGAAVREGV